MFKCNLYALETPVLSSLHPLLLVHGDQWPFMFSRCPQTFRKVSAIAITIENFHNKNPILY